MYRVVGCRPFLEQTASLSPKVAKIIDQKIDLLKDNPFRFKRLEYGRFNLYRIRVADRGRKLRLIYAVKADTVYLVGIINRKDDYLDLDALLAKALPDDW